MAIGSKGKGKSAGARIIIHIQHSDNTVFLLTIYDKSEQEDLSDNELRYLLSFIQ
ncbi:type II toxin-antitoxin system RelE/ParE family toxin [Melioribacteraceae bacterium 4301-Me]|uniref:type II toxin-antitoxin system RelE/ParE family toxin n=1 Tax=Pyranulibacter aquaticus TaxID=3163344 RepID=UPI0035965D87